MIYTDAIKKAVRFAVETHWDSTHQLRKGKDVPYITHPLTVGLILANAGGCEDVVVARILLDTVEYSPSERPVTLEAIELHFGGGTLPR